MVRKEGRRKILETLEEEAPVAGRLVGSSVQVLLTPLLVICAIVPSCSTGAGTVAVAVYWYW